MGGGAVPGAPRVLADVEVLATGLRFPEGPVHVEDGSVFVTEIHGGTITRVAPDGTVAVVAHCGDAPNGLAIGPDGTMLACNNGGQLEQHTFGRIERIDVASGSVEVLYREVDGGPLGSPNDLVFDAHGGFWFTDIGRRREHGRDYGRIMYAKTDGSAVRCVIDNVPAPNGIGLSPDGTELYWAEMLVSRLYRRAIVAPGEVEHARVNDVDSLLCGLPGLQHFDSLAVDDTGDVCVGTLLSGCITVVARDGSAAEQLTFPEHAADRMPTNICIDTDARVAYITLAETGRLIRCPWPRLDLSGGGR